VPGGEWERQMSEIEENDLCSSINLGFVWSNR
jgi:hypothetical protein